MAWLCFIKSVMILISCDPNVQWLINLQSLEHSQHGLSLVPGLYSGGTAGKNNEKGAASETRKYNQPTGKEPVIVFFIMPRSNFDNTLYFDNTLMPNDVIVL